MRAMSAYSSLFSFLVIALTVFHLAASAPSIQVSLQASFAAPPFLTELFESAIAENRSAYTPLLSTIATGLFHNPDYSDRTLLGEFEKVLVNDGHISDTDSLASWKLALALRSSAPTIEAYHQFWRTNVDGIISNHAQGVEFWREDTKICDSPECESTIVRTSDPNVEFAGHASQILPFDHISGDHSKDIFTIYADLSSSQFPSTFTRWRTTHPDSAFCLRWKPSQDREGHPLVVNGYGVELALKKTDYIVIDDREAEKKGSVINKGDTASQSVLGDEDVADVTPLSSTELEDIGWKTASYIMDSSDPYELLKKISQDFPKHAAALVSRNYSTNFVLEHEKNREVALPAGFNAFWINGVQIPSRDVNAYTLLETLRKERSLIAKFRRLGFSGSDAIRLLSHEDIVTGHSKDDPQRYDFRDATEGGNVIIWLNNIEKDKRYREYPTDISVVLQRVFPGQLVPIRKDVHNVIFPADLSSSVDLKTILENLQTLVKRRVPVQFGLVPVSRNSEAVGHAKVVYYLNEAYGISAVVTYLQNKYLKILSAHTPSFREPASYVSTITDRKLRPNHTEKTIEEVLDSEDVVARIVASQKYTSRLDADGSNPPIFGNGIPITRNEDWLQTMSIRLGNDFGLIQQAVYEGKLTQDMWFPGLFMNRSSLARNPLVIPQNDKDVKLIDFDRLITDHESIFAQLQPFQVSDNIKSSETVSVLVVTDVNSNSGAQLLLNATEFTLMHEEVELRILHQCSQSSCDDSFTIKPESVAKIQDVLETERASFSPAHREAVGRYLTGALMSQSVTLKSVDVLHNPMVADLGLAPGESGILLNGRLVGPLAGSQSFTSGDFENFLMYEHQRRIDPVTKAKGSLNLALKAKEPLTLAKLSSLIALSMVSDVPEGIYDTNPGPRVNTFNKWETSHTCIQRGDIESASIQIVVTTDPTSGVAQRWIPILDVLSSMSGVHLKLFLNPREKLQELPVKRFYRYLLQLEPTFDAEGRLEQPEAQFTGIPSETLLTMGLDTPPSWLVAPKISPHDLDNIKLSNLKNGEDVNAIYELEHILIEGHSRDFPAEKPPRGAQLVLSTGVDQNFAGTIVMANLGYFQFKANPGVYELGLQEGATKEVYSLQSAGTKGYSPSSGDESSLISLTSFQGSTVFPRLTRRPGKEKVDVLEAETGQKENLVAKGLKAADDVLAKMGIPDFLRTPYLGKAQDATQKVVSSEPYETRNTEGQADINIFSVASGHLYERMLNIMMVSVLRHTQHTVKFWFIEQFLSPSFKSFLPTMAAEYNFEYEMVTFKWPHWLRAQTEKQRMIWGYKILFLDVLFPLNLDKVIFVDADQIVRTDLYDLVQHDLQGAVYGFTPMCDSRTEMEGFRFWKQGYWKNFLRGLPYHISALYVVDLKMFRAMAAGDRLRQQYHALSADPNSLSNLDQDLPNHMQSQLPIHSLPQEWLWCETWCSDESLKDAKTIDLCNNPQTKEPKLDRARRQVPEWTIYDDEIAALARRGNNGSAVVEGLGQGHHEQEPKSDKPARRTDEL